MKRIETDVCNIAGHDSLVHFCGKKGKDINDRDCDTCNMIFECILDHRLDNENNIDTISKLIVQMLKRWRATKVR